MPRTPEKSVLSYFDNKYDQNPSCFQRFGGVAGWLENGVPPRSYVAQLLRKIDVSSTVAPRAPTYGRTVLGSGAL